MRRALLSVTVGLAGAAGVTASGWALQAGALPPPTPAARVAADASAWFHDYRLVVDVFHIDHRKTKGACLRGWFGHADGRRVRASLLSLDSGRHASGGRRVSVILGSARRLPPSEVAAAAGCSGELAPMIAGAAQRGGHVTVSRGYAANRPAIALKLSHGDEMRLTLYVAPRTRRPLVAIVALDGHEATARLYLSRVKRQILRRFHLLRLAKPLPRR